MKKPAAETTPLKRLLSDETLLSLHRWLVSIPAVSGQEERLASALEGWMKNRGWPVERIGHSLLVQQGEGPALMLNSHLDTVPVAPGWSYPPQEATRVEGKVFGLGSNDAKASVVGMLATFDACFGQKLPFTLQLALVEAEETRGIGTENVLAHLRMQGKMPEAAVIGEPTGLQVAVAQKGLLVLELVHHGQACHAANAQALGIQNALYPLAQDLLTLEKLTRTPDGLAPPHPLLGKTTLEPTVIKGSPARNMVAGEVGVVLDVRSTPSCRHVRLIEQLQEQVQGELKVLSQRLEPVETSSQARIVKAACEAQPGVTLYGSPTMSDMVFLRDVPVIKVGPGESARSHTPQEFVEEAEVLAGADFYLRLVQVWWQQTVAASEEQ